MDKDSYLRLVASAYGASADDLRQCLALERRFLEEDRQDANRIAVSMSFRQQLIAQMEDLLEKRERAASVVATET